MIFKQLKILYQLFLNVIFSVPVKVLKNIKRKSFERLNQLKKAGSKDSPTQSLSEDDLYCLDGYQLKNLLDKNIHFDFFQLDSVNENKQIKSYLKKAQLKNKEEILPQLSSNPVVLICKTGAVSKSFSRELRAKGFVNVYFIKKGFQSLLEDF